MWRKYINKIIIHVRQRIRQQLSNQFKLESNLTLPKSYREKLKTIGRKTGMSIRSTSLKKLIWRWL